MNCSGLVGCRSAREDVTMGDPVITECLLEVLDDDAALGTSAGEDPMCAPIG